MEPMNQLRGFAYVLGVLRCQQADPVCRSCNSFVKTSAALKERIDTFERDHGGLLQNLSSDFSMLFSDTKNGLPMLRLPDNPSGQKKAGNCKMPEGVCFIKSSLAILQKI